MIRISTLRFRSRVYEGVIKNVSQGAVFIETKEPLAIRQILTLAIPVATKGKSIKLKTEVAWTSPKGDIVNSCV